jgi:hypothetical protein
VRAFLGAGSWLQKVGSYPKSVMGLQAFEIHEVAEWRGSRRLAEPVRDGVPPRWFMAARDVCFSSEKDGVLRSIAESRDRAGFLSNRLGTDSWAPRGGGRPFRWPGSKA